MLETSITTDETDIFSQMFESIFRVRDTKIVKAKTLIEKIMPKIPIGSASVLLR